MSFSKEKLQQGFNAEMMEEAQRELKINKVFLYIFFSSNNLIVMYQLSCLKKQARRIYEILRFQATNLGDIEEYRAYRLDIKRRLNIPYQVCLILFD